jgi:hypothetical protein
MDFVNYTDLKILALVNKSLPVSLNGYCVASEKVVHYQNHIHVFKDNS